MFFLQQGLKCYWEKRRDGSLKLATIRDDTWNVLNMQHITPNSKRWDYSDIPGVSHGQIKGPAHMVEGGHHPRNRPPTLGTTVSGLLPLPTRWRCGLILLPSLTLRSPHPQGELKSRVSSFCSNSHCADQVTILHIPWQLSCHSMCKSLSCSDHYFFHIKQVNIFF